MKEEAACRNCAVSISRSPNQADERVDEPASLGMSQPEVGPHPLPTEEARASVG